MNERNCASSSFGLASPRYAAWKVISAGFLLYSVISLSVSVHSRLRNSTVTPLTSKGIVCPAAAVINSLALAIAFAMLFAYPFCLGVSEWAAAGQVKRDHRRAVVGD